VSDVTDEDVDRGRDAWNSGFLAGATSQPPSRWIVETVLAAVLPEHDKRVRAEVLREAAEMLDKARKASPTPTLGSGATEYWRGYRTAAAEGAAAFRARADAEEGK